MDQGLSSYLLKDGKLYLSLMADGGIYAWEPNASNGGAEAGAEAARDASVPAAPEDGGPRN